VTIQSANRAINRTLLSDGSGNFSVSGLPPGEYYVTLDAEGFMPKRMTEEVPPGAGVVIWHFSMRPRQPAVTPTPGNPLVSVSTLQVPPEAEKAFKEAQGEWKNGHLKKARERFEKALALHPEYPGALWALGQLDLAEGEAGKALERFQRATQLDPAFAYAHIGMSRALGLLGRSVESLEAAEKAIAARPDIWEGYYEKGLAAVTLNQIGTAQSCAQKVDELGHGRVPEVHLLRAGILLQQQEYPSARKELEAFLEKAPKHSQAPLARNILSQVSRKN
jgi:tetratricopeptide (TPR) repeat protein